MKGRAEWQWGAALPNHVETMAQTGGLEFTIEG
jgi:hypothetical protein